MKTVWGVLDVQGIAEWYDATGRALDDRPLLAFASVTPAPAAWSAQCADDAQLFKLWWDGGQLDAHVRAFREQKFSLAAE